MERDIYIFCFSLKMDLQALCNAHGRHHKVMKQFIATDGYITCGITVLNNKNMLI